MLIFPITIIFRSLAVAMIGFKISMISVDALRAYSMFPVYFKIYKTGSSQSSINI